jgi:hypothetical protein
VPFGVKSAAFWGMSVRCPDWRSRVEGEIPKEPYIFYRIPCMNYSINPSEDKKYITVKVIGNISRLLAVKYNLEAHALGKELGIDRFLLDFTECRNTDTVLRNYKYVYDDMKDPGINQAACTAMLVSSNDHSHDFIEALFRDAGADFTLFHDRNLALWHLTQK